MMAKKCCWISPNWDSQKAGGKVAKLSCWVPSWDSQKAVGTMAGVARGAGCTRTARGRCGSWPAAGHPRIRRVRRVAVATAEVV